jgi:hypothetical protein
MVYVSRKVAVFGLICRQPREIFGLRGIRIMLQLNTLTVYVFKNAEVFQLI